MCRARSASGSGQLTRLRVRRLPRRSRCPQGPCSAYRDDRRPGLARGRAAALAGARRLVQCRRPRLGCGVGGRLRRRVRAALPHPGDRPDERALAGDRAGLRRAARRRGSAPGRAPGGRRAGGPAARAVRGGAGQCRARRRFRAPVPYRAAAGPRRGRRHSPPADLPAPGALRQRRGSADHRPGGLLHRHPGRRRAAVPQARLRAARLRDVGRRRLSWTRWRT